MPKDLTPEELALIAGGVRAASNDEEDGDIIVTGSPTPPPIVFHPPPPTPPTPTPPPVTSGPQPPSAPDPYNPYFDCSTATPEMKAERNLLSALGWAMGKIAGVGFGFPETGEGYNYREYGSFIYRGAGGELIASEPIRGEPSGISTEWASSVTGGPVDSVAAIDGGRPFLIRDIVAFVHVHPSSTSIGNQASYPLPSPKSQLTTPQGVVVEGDYAFAEALIDMGASSNLTLGIFAEAEVGAGYKLRKYDGGAPPPHDPNDPATWVDAYGREIPFGLAPCP